MPVPSIRLHGAKQCTAKSKRTKLPCKNPAAYGSNTCRMHGARRLERIKRGKQHPNYAHGMRTLDAQKEQSSLSCRLQQIEDAMHVLGMTTMPRTRGRKAKSYINLNSIKEVKKLLDE